MNSRLRISRWLLALAVAAFFPLDARGQDPDVDLRRVAPEVLKFSFVAPPPPQVTLKAWDGILNPDHGFNYVFGPVKVDWNRLNLDWRFLWQANSSLVSSVRWEISKYPFPSDGPFVPSPGVGVVGTESANIILVDLNLLAPRPPSWTPKLAVQGITGSFQGTGVVLPPTEITPTKRLTQFGALNVRFAGAQIPEFSTATAQAYISQATPVIAQSMSLYARVVPLDADGAVAGPPSNVVVFNFFEPDPTNVIETPVFVHPVATFAGYTPVRPYNFQWSCHVVYTFDHPLGFFHKGDKANICDDGSDIVGDVLEAFADVFEFVADFVDWVSDTYSDLKSEVASQVAGTLQDFGVPCNETCASIALNAALAAAGMPPELPDVEQLQAMGEGYAVDALANYAEAQTGVEVPEAARDAMREQLHEMIDQAAENTFSGGAGSALYIPDVTYQFHGPIVVMDVANPSNQYVSMTDPLRVEDQTGRYHTETFFIPPIKPGSSFRIALTLKPFQDPKAWMDLLPGPDDSPLFGPYFQKLEAAHDALDAWRALYRTDDLVLKVTVGPYHAFTVSLPAKTN
jgi:hypothetical protein